MTSKDGKKGGACGATAASCTWATVAVMSSILPPDHALPASPLLAAKGESTVNCSKGNRDSPQTVAERLADLARINAQLNTDTAAAFSRSQTLPRKPSVPTTTTVSRPKAPPSRSAGTYHTVAGDRLAIKRRVLTCRECPCKCIPDSSHRNM